MQNRRRIVLIVFAAVLLGIAIPVGIWLAAPLFVSNTINEEFPLSRNATLIGAMSQPEAESTMQAAANQTTPMAEVMTEPMSRAVKLKQGTFKNGDSFHMGSGTALLYRLADGNYVLRLEDFKGTNGPDLRVWLTTAKVVNTAGDVTAAKVLDLGPLKGNIGSQNYEVPAGTIIDEQASVVIWCRAFSVLFSSAAFQ